VTDRRTDRQTEYALSAVPAGTAVARKNVQKNLPKKPKLGCGLGLDVSVARPSQDVLMSRLRQNAQRLSLRNVHPGSCHYLRVSSQDYFCAGVRHP